MATKKPLRIATLLPFGILLIGFVVAGVILFLPSPKTLSSLKDCPAASRFTCYAEYFKTKTSQSGPKQALHELKQLHDSNDSFAKSQCHQLAHQIGHQGFVKYGTLAAAYTKGDAFCWSGYYHGVTENAVGTMGKERIKKEANGICAELARARQYSFDHYNCVHGLGHGFMTVDDFNLFNALKTCDLLSDSWERDSCYGGVFMENVMVAVRENGHSDYLKPEQPLYPCTAVDQQHKNQCYLMQTSYALQQNGYDFAKTFILCRDKADAAFVPTCYQSIGRDASGSSSSDIARTKQNCSAAPDALGLEHCMLGAVRDFVSYHHSDTQAKSFCEAFNATLKQRCDEEVTLYYRSF